MSSNYYFNKWKAVLIQIQRLMRIDQKYQETKAHDKRRWQAAERLSGMLAAYIAVYYQVLECSTQNLQVQKTGEIHAVLDAVVDRILELKQQLRKLEGSQTQYLSSGAIIHHLTVTDAEFHDIPARVSRDEHVDAMVADAISAAKEKIRQRELEAAKEAEPGEAAAIDKWWDLDAEENDENDATTGDKFIQYDEVKELTEEQLNVRDMVALIQAHEKTRQVTQWNLQRVQRRVIWEKELLGTLAPKARLELRVRAAKLIQHVFRTFMELKRKKIREYKANEILGIGQYRKFSYAERNKAEQIKERRIANLGKFYAEWKTDRAKVKEDFLKRKHDEICEYYRDIIRDWFQEWYDKIGMFHDIPHISDGGEVAIFRGELPDPEEWYEKYKEYIAEKQKKNNKSSDQARMEKKAALMEQKILKLEELTKLKLEEELKRKMMKNPKMHPGYNYPGSKTFQKLVETVEHYHEIWDDLDEDEPLEVKERNVSQLDETDIDAEVMLEIAPEVDADMKLELKKLKKSLKKDYANAEKEMPELMPEKRKKKKPKKKLKLAKAVDNNIVAEKMEYLAENGFLKEYPRTNFEDFLGDHNFTGDDCRRLDQEAYPLCGEMRNLWWERCREVTKGFHRILLVGPPGSGRTTLVHAMASVNNAVLFELVPQQLDVDLVTASYLQEIIHALEIGARAAQPAILYIRNVQHFFYKKKKDANQALPNAELIKQYFITKLFKAFNKYKMDNITIIGGCSDPWRTRSKLLKQFPEVVLLPDTSYSVIVQLFKNWVINNNCIPRDLDVHTLAHLLRGYSFRVINDVLQHFLTPELVVKMAGYGLTAQEIYEYAIENGVEKSNYEEYLKWYSNNTFWGKKEKKQLKEAREFRALEQRYAEQMEKKKKKGTSAPGSETGDGE